MESVHPVDRKEENELVLSVLAGNSAAFDTLYQRYVRRVYLVCLRMVDDPTVAEDLTQEAFILAFRRLSTYRQEARFSTWLHTIAVNTVLMFFRKRRSGFREQSLENPVRGNEDVSKLENEVYGRPDETLRMAVDRVTLQRAIANLPEGYRMMVILHDIQGYQHEEIAQMLGCTTGNTKSQLHKARLKLRDIVLDRNDRRGKGRQLHLKKNEKAVSAAAA